MKQLLLSAVLLLFSISIFAQATPVGELRVADAGTAFGVNVPAGTKIYQMDTKQYWVCVDGAASTAKLNSHAGSVINLLNAVEQSMTTTSSGTTAVINLSKTTLTTGTEVAASDVVTIGTSGPSIAITSDASKNITITATEKQALLYTTATDKGTINISGGGGSSTDITVPAASASVAGLLTTTQYATLFTPSSDFPVKLYVDVLYQGSTADADFTLLNTPIAGQQILVSLNGQELPESVFTGVAPKVFTVRGYTRAAGSKTLTIDLPTVQYDKVVVTYMK
ncbi:MAG: hypothetical protein WCP85_28500 [Mariniphaga sp.]